MPVDQKLLQFVGLARLKIAVEDDRFIGLLSSISHIIKKSEERCERALDVNDENYIDVVNNEEHDNVEEAIGIALVALQTKIRRVSSVAERAPFNRKRKEIFELGSNRSIKVIWGLANYYKHHYDWRKPYNKLVLQTLELVSAVGITDTSGDLQAALKNLGILHPCDCTRLADYVQEWAELVLKDVKDTTIQA